MMRVHQETRVYNETSQGQRKWELVGQGQGGARGLLRAHLQQRQLVLVLPCARAGEGGERLGALRVAKHPQYEDGWAPRGVRAWRDEERGDLCVFPHGRPTTLHDPLRS